MTSRPATGNTSLPDYWLTPRELTPSDFAPFGEVIRSGEGERIYTWSSKSAALFGLGDEGPSTIHRTGALESDHEVEFLVMRNRPREPRVRFVERHLHITQMMIPLGGDPFVLVVAPPTDKEGEFPGLQQLTAFIVPGDTAVNLRRGTWHEVPFPIGATATVLVASHSALTAGLMAKLGSDGDLHQGDVDKRDITKRYQTVVRLRIPSAEEPE